MDSNPSSLESPAEPSLGSWGQERDRWQGIPELAVESWSRSSLYVQLSAHSTAVLSCATDRVKNQGQLTSEGHRPSPCSVPSQPLPTCAVWSGSSPAASQLVSQTSFFSQIS